LKKRIPVLSVGTDIVEVNRIKVLIDRYSLRFLNRIFSNEEIKYCENMANPAIHYAGRFSAKEAVVKALSSRKDQRKFLSYNKISISNNNTGKPFVRCDTVDSDNIHISISHTKEHAIAFAIYSRDDKSS